MSRGLASWGPVFIMVMGTVARQVGRAGSWEKRGFQPGGGQGSGVMGDMLAGDVHVLTQYLLGKASLLWVIPGPAAPVR